VRYGLRNDDPTLLGMYRKTREQARCGEGKTRIVLGTYVLSGGLLRRLLPESQKVRALIRTEFRDAFKR